MQAIFRADVSQVREFSRQHESTERQFVSARDLPVLHHEWNAVLQAALDMALEQDGL
jgi:hypothetical protein